MMLFGLHWSWGALWLASSLLLALAELIAPGFFLIFIAIGGALTGLSLVVVPEVPSIVQVVLFALFTTAAVAIGRRWYHRRPPTSDPLLNDRAARLVGQKVEVCEAIAAGEGRVRVGDGTWVARGPDVAMGAVVRIVGADGSILLVEPA